MPRADRLRAVDDLEQRGEGQEGHGERDDRGVGGVVEIEEGADQQARRDSIIDQPPSAP